MLEREQDPRLSVSDCLAGHKKIVPQHRMRMIDWMIEVINILKCS